MTDTTEHPPHHFDDFTRQMLLYSRFLKGESLSQFIDLDRSCIPSQFLHHSTWLRTILPLYYNLTRNGNKMSIAEMKRVFGCGAALINRVRKAIVEKKPIPFPKPGKKNIRNNPLLRRLVDESTIADGHVSDADLSRILGTSRNTINRIRHDLNFKYKALSHGPLLTERQIAARLIFCRNNTDIDWSKVLFSDESRFSTAPDSQVRWWVKRGHRVFIQAPKYPPSIMVWGGIIGPRKTPLIKCPQRLNAQSYIEMLEAEGIVAFLRQQGEGVIFQQDGAPCHTAATTMMWFRDNDVECLRGWPANSPDLSPIEQVWGIMKRFLVQWYGMRTPLTIQQLERAVFEAYNTINWMSIGVLALSAKYRVQLCLERGGHFIGDAIDECCRRAKIELETQTDIIFLSVHEEVHESFHADDTC